MFKTKKQIISDLQIIDIVIELLDSRIPVASRNPDIKEITKNKKRIIILNKCDLSNEVANKKWESYFSKEAPTLLVDSNTGYGINKVIKLIDKIMIPEKEKEQLRGRVNKTIRVMILGIPNVGKSSFINRISKRVVAEVGNRPGVTKQKQWIRIAQNQELLDTPGVLWPKFENEKIALDLAFTGSIKDDILERVDVAYELLKILKENYLINLIERYKITEEEVQAIEKEENSVYELMKIIGKKRGALVSGGQIDDEKTARIILEDFRNCKLGKITLELP